MKTPILALASCAVALWCGGAYAAQLPSDVRSNHWAAAAVTRSLQSGLLHVQSDGRFHGDAKVTRLEAAQALATLGRALTAGTWKPAGRSHPVTDSVEPLWAQTDWKTAPVRRYAFAVIVTRMGDFVANGIAHHTSADGIGKSEVLPDVTVTLPTTSPGFAAVTYLAHNRMVKPGSPLLKADDGIVLGGDLSRALAELATGVTDRLTDLGKNADGSTPDDALRTPKKL